MRGISWFVSTSPCRSILLRLIFIKLFGNENFSGEKDSGKVLITIIILFLIIRWAWLPRQPDHLMFYKPHSDARKKIPAKMREVV